MVRNFLIPLVIVVVFGFGAFTLLATAPVLSPSAQVPVPLAVNVLEVTPEVVQMKVHSQGSVQPSTESQLIPEVSGKVVWISPNLVAGGYFDLGEPLVRMETSDYQSSEQRAQAAVVRSEAELEHARFEYNRQRSLLERKLTSRAQYENARRQLRVAESALKDARASLARADQDLRRTELVAPFAGLVRTESIDVGQFVPQGTPIATLYAGDVAEVRLPIADRQLAFLNIPPTVRGELPLSQQPKVVLSAEYAGQQLEWHGTIVRTEAEIDVSSRMVQLVARVPNRPEQTPLTVGLFVEAEIEGLSAEDIVVLPRSALRNNDQVLIVDNESKLRFRDVNVLRLYQDDVLINDGLEQGDRVCLSALQTPVDGMTVEAVPG